MCVRLSFRLAALGRQAHRKQRVCVCPSGTVPMDPPETRITARRVWRVCGFTLPFLTFVLMFALLENQRSPRV